MEIHVVQSGETLYGIAGRYGVDPSLLRELNGLEEDAALAVGQTLVIRQVATFHIVQPGQTLDAIARSGSCTGITTSWAAIRRSHRGSLW